MTTPSNSSFEETFVFSKWMKIQMWLAAFIFSGFAILGAVLFFVPSANAKGVGLACMLMFGFFDVFSILMIFRLREKIVINEQGVTSCYPSKEPVTLRWNEIEKLRDRPMLQRLELHGFNSFVMIKLENQLENFDRARALVLEKTRFLEQQNVQEITLPAIFPKISAYTIIVFVSFLFFTVLPIICWIQNEPWGMLLFLINIAWLFEWYKVEVHPDAILLHYPFRTKRIEASQIAHISMQSLHLKGTVTPIVILTFFDRTTLSLGGTKNGILPFYKALCIMKETSSKAQKPSASV